MLRTGSRQRKAHEERREEEAYVSVAKELMDYILAVTWWSNEKKAVKLRTKERKRGAARDALNACDSVDEKPDWLGTE